MSCDLTIDGVLDCEGTGTGTGNTVIPTRLVAGSQTISSGKVLLEDGTGLLNEDGSDIVLNASAGVAAVDVDILNEDGTSILNEDGTKVLNESSTASTITPGAATPLMYVTTLCSAVTVTAKSSNLGDIWIAGSDVEEGLGNPLYVRGSNIRIEVDDVAKVYIIGNIGDGVTFMYETTEEAPESDGSFVRDDSGNIVSDDSGNQVSF